MALTGHRDAFFILIIVSFVTDLVDGPIARWSGSESEFGARLDTTADASTILVGIFGLYLFEKNTLWPELPWFCLFLASYGAAAIACQIKFGRLPAYHLYLSKAAAFCAAVFFVWLFAFGYSRPLLLTAVSLGVLANFESLLATLRLDRFASDISSILLSSAKQRNGDN